MLSKKISKYLILSIIPFGGDIFLYYFLINFLNFSIYLSFSLAFIFGSLLAFSITPLIFNNKLNFKKYFFKFLLIEIFVIFIGEFIILSFLFEKLDINYFLSKLIATGIIFIFSFILKNILLTKK